jgi:hypothetical protein
MNHTSTGRRLATDRQDSLEAMFNRAMQQLYLVRMLSERNTRVTMRVIRAPSRMDTMSGSGTRVSSSMPRTLVSLTSSPPAWAHDTRAWIPWE